MAHTRTSILARASSAGNPVSVSATIPAGVTVLCLLIKGTGATNRAGAAPSLSGGEPTSGTITFTQANSTQKAAASPEASAELWYAVPNKDGPVRFKAGTYTLTIPNTGAITLKYTLEAGSAPAGGRSEFLNANGGNGTSTNPTPGAVTVDTAGSIGWAITAGGWTTWAPSAQVGTIIANTDDGADGGGEQYILSPAIGSHTLSWTFGTSDDWGAVSAYFREVPPPNDVNRMGGAAGGDGLTVVSRGF